MQTGTRRVCSYMASECGIDEKPLHQGRASCAGPVRPRMSAAAAGLLAASALLVPDVVDGRADAGLGQHPALVGQPTDELNLSRW